MTEDKKNTEETQEKEEFEVVMPEANRVEMPATEFKEQPDYLKTFANFYISKFDESDLEIMDVYDGNHDVIEINTYLTNNMAFSRQNLVKHVLNIHAAGRQLWITPSFRHSKQTGGRTHKTSKL